MSPLGPCPSSCQPYHQTLLNIAAVRHPAPSSCQPFSPLYFPSPFYLASIQHLVQVGCIADDLAVNSCDDVTLSTAGQGNGAQQGKRSPRGPSPPLAHTNGSMLMMMSPCRPRGKGMELSRGDV